MDKSQRGKRSNAQKWWRLVLWDVWGGVNGFPPPALYCIVLTSESNLFRTAARLRGSRVSPVVPSFLVKPYTSNNRAVVVTVSYSRCRKWLWPLSCLIGCSMTQISQHAYLGLILSQSSEFTVCPALKDLCPSQLPVQSSHSWAYDGPTSAKTVDGNRWLEGSAQSGRGRQTFKRAYCCNFHSGFDCLCFDLVWGGHVVQCYPPIISAIPQTLQWERHWLRSSAPANIVTFHREHE